MKKILALLFAAVLCLGLVACDTDPADDVNVKSEGVMTYAEYMAAEMDAAVVIEAYVQGHQAWWEDEGQGLITVYAQDPDGAYFIYEMKCSEEDAAKLTDGAKIRVSGYKTAWEGEVEIVDATLEVLEGEWIAETLDVTDLLGKDELIDHQNKKVSFKGLTVESISYKDSEWDKDIYLTVSLNGTNYEFCVENYLTGPDTDVYKAVAALKVGDVVDVEGFLYWYQGVNTHITGVTAAQ